MNHPVEYLKYFLFLSQEIKLDAATPGQTAKDRLQRNCALLFDTGMALASYWNVDVQKLMADAWRQHPGSASEAKEKGKKK